MKIFWDRVDKSGDCWEWTGGKTAYGYGVIRIDRVTHAAHRLSVQLTGVEIPKGMVVMHSCDNPGCVNPDHLSVATHKENSQDMVRKGRNRGYTLGGEHNGINKLTEQDVRQIRASHVRRDKTFGANALAKKFGVTQRTILSVVARETWKNVA